MDGKSSDNVLTRLFREFSRQLSKNAVDRDTILQTAVESCMRILKTESCSLWLIDESQVRLRLHSAKGSFARLSHIDPACTYYHISRHEEHPEGITVQILKEGCSFLASSTDELRMHRSWRGRFDSIVYCGAPEIVQFYGTPIGFGDRILGVLKTETSKAGTNHHPQPFSLEERVAFDAMAMVIGSVLHYHLNLKYNPELVQSIVAEVIRSEEPRLNRISQDVLWIPTPSIMVIDEWECIARTIVADSDSLYDLDWKRFEDLITHLLRDSGWSVTPMGYTKDGGIDVLSVCKLPPGVNVQMIVQCKRNAKHRKVGIQVLRELWSIKWEQAYHQAMVATTSSFTKGAIEQAEVWRMDLRDHDAIVDWCREYTMRSR